MHLVRRLTIAAAILSILGACDPVNWVGARLRVAPVASDSCYLNAMRRSFGRASFEAIDPSRETSIHLALPDSVGSLAANSTLRLLPLRDSVFAVELTTNWMGNRTIDEQRRFVAAATSVLEQLRAACADSSAAHIDCLAQGLLLGHSACERGT